MPRTFFLSQYYHSLIMRKVLLKRVFSLHPMASRNVNILDDPSHVTSMSTFPNEFETPLWKIENTAM